MKQVDMAKLLETDWADQFNPQQLAELRDGLTNNVDIRLYANPNYASSQMFVIRMALREGIDITPHIDITTRREYMWEVYHRLKAERFSDHMDDIFKDILTQEDA